MSKQKIFLNHCEIFVQKINLPEIGHVYLMWKKGKKHAQTERFKTNGKTIHIREKLQMNIKMYVKFDELESRESRLFLLSDDDQEIWSTTLPVHTWSDVPTKKTYDISNKKVNKGSITVRLSRKQGLELDNFERNFGEIEESSEEDRIVKRNIETHSLKFESNSELIKLRKQVEDCHHIISKLKADRIEYLTNNEELYNENNVIKERIRQELQRIEQHYQKKIQMRESVFEEAIQELIEQFNDNYSVNSLVLHNVIEQNQKFYQTIVGMRNDHADQLRKKEEDYIEKVDNFEAEHFQLQKKFQLLEERLSQTEERLEDREKRIIQLEEEKSHLMHEYSNEKAEIMEQIKQKVEQISSMDENIKILELKLEQTTQKLNLADQKILNYENQAEEYKEQIAKHEAQYSKIIEQNMKQSNEIHRLQGEVQNLNLEVENREAQISNYKQEEKELLSISNEKDKEHSDQIKHYLDIIEEKEKQMNENMEKQQNKLIELSEQNHQLEIQLQQLQHKAEMTEEQLKIKTEQMQRMENQTDMQKEMFDKAVVDYTEQIKDKIARLGEVEARNNTLETQNHLLRHNLSEAEEKYTVQIEEIRDQYENLTLRKDADYQQRLEKLKQDYIEQEAKYYNDIENLQNQNMEQRVELQKKHTKELIHIQDQAKKDSYISELEEQIQKLRELINKYENINKSRDKMNEDIDRIRKRMNSSEIDERFSETNSIHMREVNDDEQVDNKKKDKGDENIKVSLNYSFDPKEKFDNQVFDENMRKQYEKELKAQREYFENKQAFTDERIKQMILQNDRLTIQLQTQERINEELEEKVIGYEKQIDILDEQLDEFRYRREKELQDQKQGLLNQSQKDSPKMKKKVSSAERKHKKMRSFDRQIGSERQEKKEKRVKQVNYQVQVELLREEGEKQIQTVYVEKPVIVYKEAAQSPSVSKKKVQRMQSDRSISQKKTERNLEEGISQNNRQYINYQNSRQIEEFRRKLRQKQQNIHELKERNMDLFDQVSYLKREMIANKDFHESKLLEFEQRESQRAQRLNNYSSNYEQVKKVKQENQTRIEEIKGKNQELILENKKVNYENQQLRSDIQHLKKQLAQLQNKQKKNANYGFIQTLQSDLEEANKSIITLTKNLHLTRLQKENLEEEKTLVKKKQHEMEKKVQFAEQKSNSLDQDLENSKRNERKLKRDVQDKQQELKKAQGNLQRIQEQINSLNSYSSISIYDKKKNIEEKMQYEDKINQKDKQLRKLQKEIQKYQKKIQDDENYRGQKKSQMRKQIQRLEKELISSTRKNSEYEEQVKRLNSRLNYVEKQKKKTSQQQSQSFSDKLQFYVQEIANIQTVLDENEQQNIYMKNQNDSLLGQNEYLKQNLNNLEMKYNDLVDYHEKVENQLQDSKQKYHELMNECDHYQKDSAHLHENIANLHCQLDKQRSLSQKKTQKIEEYEEVTEKYIYQLKNCKIRIKQYQSQDNVTQDLSNRLKNIEEQYAELLQKHTYIAKEYGEYKSNYTYTNSQIEEVVKQLEESFEALRKEELEKLKETLQEQFHQKTLKLQTDVLELYNQNAKLGIEKQKVEDDNTEIMEKFKQIQGFPKKYQSARDRISFLENQINLLKNQDIQYSSKNKRAQLQKKETQRKLYQLKHEYDLLSSSYQNQKDKNFKLENQLNEALKGQELLKEEVSSLRSGKNYRDQELNIRIQAYENKILSLELENARIHQSEENMNKEYKDKIRKLQQKIKQLEKVMREEVSSIERQTTIQIQLKNKEIKNLNEELQRAISKSAGFQSTQQSLKEENEEILLQLTNVRTQLQEDEQMYMIEINQLKNRLKDTEQVYNMNINSLEEELALLNRELTMEKLKKKSESIIGSRLRESEVDRRLQEKIRSKDMKIEELKNNIYILEETILKLKRRDSQQNLSLSKADKYQLLYEQLKQKSEQQKESLSKESQRLAEIIRQQKRQLLRIKEKEQELSMKLDHQNLELDSAKCELKTIQQLYSSLQKQIDKRKSKMGQQIQTQNHNQKEIQYKNLKIGQLEEKCSDLTQKIEEISAKLLKKEHYSIELSEKNQQLHKKLNKLKHQNSSLTGENYKKTNEIKDFKQENENNSTQNQRLRNQLDLLKGQMMEQKNITNIQKKELNQLKQEKQELISEASKNSQNSEKYLHLMEKCFEQYNITLEELILGGYFEERIFEKEEQINKLAQQLEELRFMKDRKLMDYNQLKKNNFELNIKLEDFQILNGQVESLRRICDKLEQEKKVAVFREEGLRMHVQNLLPSAHNDLRVKLENILLQDYDLYS